MWNHLSIQCWEPYKTQPVSALKLRCRLSNRNANRKKSFEKANTINLTSSVALEKMPEEFGPKWWWWSMVPNIPATFCQLHRLSIGFPLNFRWHRHTRGQVSVSWTCDEAAWSRMVLLGTVCVRWSGHRVTAEVDAAAPSLQASWFGRRSRQRVSAVSSEIFPCLFFQNIVEPFASDIKFGLIYYLTAKWNIVIVSYVLPLIGSKPDILNSESVFKSAHIPAFLKKNIMHTLCT